MMAEIGNEGCSTDSLFAAKQDVCLRLLCSLKDDTELKRMTRSTATKPRKEPKDSTQAKYHLCSMFDIVFVVVSFSVGLI